MIIGSRDVSAMSVHVADLSAYAVSLVPSQYRKNREIVNNQKIYVALMLRKRTEIKYETRVSLCNRLLTDVYLTGCVNEFIEIGEVYDYVNFDKLLYNLVIKR